MGYLSPTPIPEKPKISLDSPLLCFKDSRHQGQMKRSVCRMAWGLGMPQPKGDLGMEDVEPWDAVLEAGSDLFKPSKKNTQMLGGQSHTVTRARRKPLRQEEKPGKGEKHRVSWHHAGRWPAPRSVVGTELRLPGLFRQLAKLCLSVSSVCEGRLYSRWTLEGLDGCQDRMAAGEEVKVVEGHREKRIRREGPCRKPPASHSKSPGRQPMLSSCPNPLPPHTVFTEGPASGLWP